MEPLRPSGLKHVSFSDAERDAIRQQLERMLANPLFKNSKRYPTLLRHVVEATLDGRTTDLKERALGVDVFGRDADYDTNADPVVRATAGEIRKRIALYYHDHGRESEIRIELSPGSYVPEFEIPAALPPSKPILPAAPPAAVIPAPVELTTWSVSRKRTLALGLVTVVVVAAAVSFRLTQPGDLDRFWRPVLESPSNVLLCVGQREFLGSSPEAGQASQRDIPKEVSGPITLFQLYYLGSQNVALSDAKTLSGLTGLLQSKGKSFRLRGQSSTSLGDLRDGPVVLVGAFNNDWTMNLMGPLRFNFERTGDVFWIKDRQNSGKTDLAVNYRTPYLDVSEDYALISRVLDPTTDRMVVVVGGLTGYGTVAAGEFLTDPRFFAAISDRLPPHWERKNIQLLLSTKVIHGNSGAPRVIDSYFW